MAVRQANPRGTRSHGKDRSTAQAFGTMLLASRQGLSSLSCRLEGRAPAYSRARSAFLTDGVSAMAQIIAVGGVVCAEDGERYCYASCSGIVFAREGPDQGTFAAGEKVLRIRSPEIEAAQKDYLPWFLTSCTRFLHCARASPARAGLHTKRPEG
jgi:hypothetical protein